LMCKNLGK